MGLDEDKLSENTSWSEHNHTDIHNFPWEIPFTVVEVILSIIIIVGNGIVLIAYLRNRRLRTLSHFFLINLVISDLIVGLSLPINILTYFIPLQHLNISVCTLRFTIIATPLSASTTCLLWIAVERHMSIVNPFHYESLLTKRIRYLMITATWVFSVTLMLILPMSWPRVVMIKHPIDCDLARVIPVHYWRSIILPIAYIVFVAIIILCLRILNVARNQIKSIELLVVQVSKSDKRSLANVRLAKTGFILLGLFLICWLPFTVILTVEIVGGYQNNDRILVVRFCSMLLAISSSAINPLIYAARIRRFKIAIKKLLRLHINLKDQYETYEIRQSFKLRRESVIGGCLAIDSQEGSNSSDVYQASQGFDNCTGNQGMDTRNMYEQYRKARSLSRISESPESMRSQSPTSDPPNQFVNNHIKNSIYSIQDEPNIIKPSPNIPRKRPARPHFLGLTATIGDMLNEKVSTPSAQSPGMNRLTVDTSRLERPEPPTSSIQRSTLPETPRDSLLFSEPITVDCNDNSEFFRLVVKRVIRNCSDTESDHESSNSSDGANDTENGRQSTVTSTRSARTTGDSMFKRFSSFKRKPKRPTTPLATLNKTLKDGRAVKKSATGTSAKEVHIDPEDSLTFQLRHAKGMKGVLSQIGNSNDIELRKSTRPMTPRLFPRRERVRTASGNFSHNSTLDRTSVKTGPETPSAQSITKTIFEGTLRRLRRNRQKNEIRIDERTFSELTVVPLDKNGEHSQSMEDLTKSTNKAAITTVHRRVRSNLETGNSWISEGERRNPIPSSTTPKYLHPGDEKSNSPSPQLKVKQNEPPNLAGLRHGPLSPRLTDILSPYDNTSEFSFRAESTISEVNEQTNYIDPYLPSPVILRPSLLQHRSILEERLTFTKHKDFDNANVILPITLRMPGQKSHHLWLTKQDIYKRRARASAPENPVRRRRSMSQPNIQVTKFPVPTNKQSMI